MMITVLVPAFGARQEGNLPTKRLFEMSTKVRFVPQEVSAASAPLNWFFASSMYWMDGMENRKEGIGPMSLFDDASSTWSLLILLKSRGISDLKELFAIDMDKRLKPRDGNSGPIKLLLKSRFSRTDKLPRSGTLPLSRFLLRTRLSNPWKVDTDSGMLPYMKFELIFSTTRDRNRLIFGGNGPHNPKKTSVSLCKPESLVKTVKNESSENLVERV